jgi:hypothetical protein
MLEHLHRAIRRSIRPIGPSSFLPFKNSAIMNVVLPPLMMMVAPSSHRVQAWRAMARFCPDCGHADPACVLAAAAAAAPWRPSRIARPWARAQLALHQPAEVAPHGGGGRRQPGRQLAHADIGVFGHKIEQLLAAVLIAHWLVLIDGVCRIPYSSACFCHGLHVNRGALKQMSKPH